MIDLKKKCWREKVTAEITLAHMLQFAKELGSNLDAAEVAEFLNQKGLAQGIWMHMMQAGEAYIKANLERRVIGLHNVKQSTARASLLH